MPRRTSTQIRTHLRIIPDETQMLDVGLFLPPSCGPTAYCRRSCPCLAILRYLCSCRRRLLSVRQTQYIMLLEVRNMVALSVCRACVEGSSQCRHTPRTCTVSSLIYLRLMRSIRFNLEFTFVKGGVTEYLLYRLIVRSMELTLE